MDTTICWILGPWISSDIHLYGKITFVTGLTIPSPSYSSPLPTSGTLRSRTSLVSRLPPWISTMEERWTRTRREIQFSRTRREIQFSLWWTRIRREIQFSHWWTRIRREIQFSHWERRFSPCIERSNSRSWKLRFSYELTTLTVDLRIARPIKIL